MIVDVHNHVGRDEDGVSLTPEELISIMDASGIRAAVIFPFNDPDAGPTFQLANNRIKAAEDRYPDRLIGFFRLDPYYGREALEELERCVQLGLHGLKLHPRSQRFSPEHPFISKILEALQESGLPLIIHTERCNFIARPEQLATLADRFPDLKIISAHLGYAGSKIIPLAKDRENLYLDLSLSPLFLLQDVISEVGAEKLLFASDTPYSHPKIELTKLELLDCSKRDLEKIKGENARKLLNLKK